MAKKEKPFDPQAFIKAQSDIRAGRATIATCGYIARTHGETDALLYAQEEFDNRKKRAAAERDGRPVAPLNPERPDPTLSLRQLVRMACDHPAGGIPIGRAGFPPSGPMVNRAVRKGYATLERTGAYVSCQWTRLIPTEKGRAFAARG